MGPANQERSYKILLVHVLQAINLTNTHSYLLYHHLMGLHFKLKMTRTAKMEQCPFNICEIFARVLLFFFFFWFAFKPLTKYTLKAYVPN